MAASLIRHLALPRFSRPWVLVPIVPLAAIAGLSWYLTADIQGPSASERAAAAIAPIPKPLPLPSAPVRTDVPPPWPEGRIEGTAAKQILINTLQAVAERINSVDGYTATFRKQERMRGVLGPLQTMSMKVRQRPFAVYLRFVNPTPGKEVVYAEGKFDNLMIAHSTGLSRLLVPRLAVPPDHPIALAENRHAITDIGLEKLTSKLLAFRKQDLVDPEAETILDRTTDPDGRRWLRSVHLHPRQTPDRPFARIEVLYDPETRFPLRISNFDWPDPSHPGDFPLAECYTYDDLDLKASLSAVDFDPSNPAYAFHRY